MDGPDADLYIVVELRPHFDKESIGQILMYSWALGVEGAEIQTNQRTFSVASDAYVQPVIGSAGPKQDYFVDFLEWYGETVIGPIDSGIGPDYINQLHLAVLEAPPEYRRSFQEQILRDPVKEEVEEFLDRHVDRPVVIEEWFVEPSIKIRKQRDDEPTATDYEQPDLLGIAEMQG